MPGRPRGGGPGRKGERRPKGRGRPGERKELWQLSPNEAKNIPYIPIGKSHLSFHVDRNRTMLVHVNNTTGKPVASRVIESLLNSQPGPVKVGGALILREAREEKLAGKGGFVEREGSKVEIPKHIMRSFVLLERPPRRN